MISSSYFGRCRFLQAFLPPVLLFFGAEISLNAQEGPHRPAPPHPGNSVAVPMRNGAIMVRMVTRVLEKDGIEAWNSDTYKVTLPGHPVGLKIVGENVAVFVQFTPYPRRSGRGVLVAQGQIFTETPEGEVQCRTIMHTVPLEYDEQLFFFPLGPGKSDDEAHIEIQIEMNRYNSTRVSEVPPETLSPPETVPGQ
ncbi:MAG: hypothetical protein LBD86_01955 [Spirochaetaceae bacterium]|nr:hypothetical protein [Spirochaetaceae bacterium]